MFRKLITLLVLAFAVTACGSSNNTGSTGDGGNGDGGTTASAYCDLILDFQGMEERFADFDPTDPEQFRELFTELEAALQRIAAAAPAELKADIEAGRDFFVSLNATFAAADYDITKLTPEDLEGFSELGEVFENETITSYNETECGVSADTE